MKAKDHAERHSEILVHQKEKLHKQIDELVGNKPSIKQRPTTSKMTTISSTVDKSKGLMGGFNPLLAEINGDTDSFKISQSQQKV